MAALTDQAIQDSHEQLLHVDRDGGGNGTTRVNVKDGDNGTTFLLQLATNVVGFGATFGAWESAGGTSYFTMVADDGVTLYVYLTNNGVAYEWKFSTTAPS